MFNYLINTVQRWDDRLIHRPAFQSIALAIQQSIPILAIDIYCRLVFKLILFPDALFANILKKYPIFPDTIVDHARFILSNLDIAVAMVFVIGLTYHYLTARGVKNTSLPIVTNFIATYILLFQKDQLPTYITIQYLLITILTLLSCATYYWLHKHFSATTSPFNLKYLLWSIIIISFNVMLHPIIQWPRLQTMFATLLSQNFFTSFLGLLLIAILAPFLFVLGFSIPPELTNNQTTLNTVISNLDAMLTHSISTLPFPENLYSIYGSFTLFGGIGNTLALNLLLLFAASKKYRRLAILAWLPSLFDNNFLLYAGIPIFLRPLMLIPMLLINIIGTLIAYLAVFLHFTQPVVFITPSGMPNVLLPTLASSTPIQSTIIAILIFCLSILIYYPFTKRLMIEVPNEK